MSSYKIRLADEKDSNACINLSKASWPDWWIRNERRGSEHIKTRIKEKCALVAIDKKEIVAYFVWGTLWNKVHLHDLFVKEAHRRAGLGTTFINKAVEIAKERGFREIVSDCDVSNKPSIAFHLKNDFKKVGQIKNNWDDEDSYVFSKLL